MSQIECDARWRPDDGCLQWFTGATGTIYTYNYQGGKDKLSKMGQVIVCFIGGTHLSNQQYSNCIRPEQGYCSIAYSSCTTTSFKMGNPSTAAPAFSLGDACVTDYVIISGQQKFCNFIKNMLYIIQMELQVQEVLQPQTDFVEELSFKLQQQPQIQQFTPPDSHIRFPMNSFQMCV